MDGEQSTRYQNRFRTINLIIMQNTTYQHKHIKDLTCVVLEQTSKGYKVQQTEGKKRKTAYYNAIDFHPEKGLWIRKEAAV